jgi:hypothetical protein
MSMPYPQDRARARQEDGEQPFKDAKEAFAENEAELERKASRVVDAPESEADARARQEQEAAERFEEIGDEVAGSRDGG